jgi:hypothetical protein
MAQTCDQISPNSIDGAREGKKQERKGKGKGKGETKTNAKGTLGVWLVLGPWDIYKIKMRRIWSECGPK